VFELYKTRLRNRTAYVESLLDKGLDLNVADTYA